MIESVDVLRRRAIKLEAENNGLQLKLRQAERQHENDALELLRLRNRCTILESTIANQYDQITTLQAERR